ncbi:MULTISPECIES: ChaN family lipoprotein [unclassified Pseudomonas]|uniref:ChaN family lipoprotein n=1 Tax=unclassified Pseudomonas TaxID=196821 RepID=UPI000D3BC4C6|nr:MULTISPECIES: ChaN family lipoprotein [unclassified Pseudomonas]RAU41373.1 iron(III) ABC transporter [Pseudomonas sp. RIT 409]RAU48379.1 iron(III) ABC transporter [Pseudomonas sp. RIT 412]
MIQDLSNGKTLTTQQLISRLVIAPRVLVGEQHDNPNHPALALWLLQALSDQRPQGSLLLEMLTPEQQSKVDSIQRQIRQGRYPTDVQAELDWQIGWDWTFYGPIMRFALAQPYPVLAANLAAHEVAAIYHQRLALGGVLSTSASEDAALLAQVRESNGGLLQDAFPAILAIHLQRNRRMAQRVFEAPTPVLLLAGSDQVRKDSGVPLHIADLSVAEKPVVLLFARAGTVIEPGSTDFVWYTPASPEHDGCAPMRMPSR